MIVAVVSSAIIGGIGLNSSAILGIDATASITAQAAQTVNVKNGVEFEAALMNANVTTINVTGNIKLTTNIPNIPARDFEIIGNKDQGFTIDTNKFALYGKRSLSYNPESDVTLSVVNANIVGDQSVGRFFNGGPSVYGWNLTATDVDYTGARFVHLSEGKLTFGGTNNIQTRCENAWVHDLEFLPGSVYNGQAATKDYGQFSAFYFNGSTVNGKASGKVDIGDEATVNVVISPQSTINYYYPVFYDKVYQVNVGKKATLDVDAAGVAFQFIPRADYQNIPSLNLDQESTVKFNGRGGGKYQTVKLQQYGTQINQENESKLYIDGTSSLGVVESIYEYSAFNFYGAAQLSLANHQADAPIFRGDRTFIKAADVNKIFTWDRSGGTYPAAQMLNSFDANRTFDTYIGLGGDARDNDVSAEVFSRNADIREQFQMSDYGKVIFTVGTTPDYGE